MDNDKKKSRNKVYDLPLIININQWKQNADANQNKRLWKKQQNFLKNNNKKTKQKL